jgi:hypothetical protein
MASFTAVSLCDALHRAVFLDVFPESDEVAAIFGMSVADGEDKSIVLGVWQCIYKNGLAPRQQVLTAIRNHSIREFFHQQNERLLPLRIPYSWRLLSAHYSFNPCYQLSEDPPLDLFKELSYAESDALDAYAVPRFQTHRTQKKLWDRVDELAMMLLQQPPDVTGTVKLKGLLHIYKEAQEIYNVARQPPAEVVAHVEAVFPNWKDEDSDED